MSAKKTEYAEIGSAELKVDFYAGKSGAKIKQEWHGFFDGDRGDGKIGKQITLSAAHFRPGTRIIIQEPICPECDLSRELCELDAGCDFNWLSWDEERYA